jgi:hypothetical protein
MSLLTRTKNGQMDQHGNPVVGDADGVALYDRAVDAYLRFGEDVVPLATQLVTEHDGMAMAHGFLAYLQLASTDEPDVAGARSAWQAMGATELGERESAHHDAIGAWVSGDWVRASRTLDALLQRWPADVLALQVGHGLDFFLGDAANLRDRPGRTLPELDPDHPHTGFVHGMQAFGLEESGDYTAAEQAGLRAIEVNPDDVWAIHAVVHTHEMRGQVDQGIRFLTSREDDWGSGNLFTVHNWWHLALFLLEAGAVDGSLSIYDERVHNAESAGVSLEMVDASSLLWRLFLDGHDTGDRFDKLADAWQSTTESAPWYAFNDLHAVMAFVGAGRIGDAERHVEKLAGYVHQGGTGTNVAMTSEIGLPSSRAIVRFAQERYTDVVDELMPIRRVFSHFGGSHAQRDALQRTLLEAALRSDQLDLARALTAERLSVRDTSVYGWNQRARVERAFGNDGAATSAELAATANQARFSAARNQ